MANGVMINTERDAIEMIRNATPQTVLRAYYEVGNWCADNDIDFDRMEDHYSYSDLADEVFMRSTHNMQEFYRIGFDGYAFPIYATGFRYGNIPSNGRSHNYRDDYAERGVSVAWIENGDQTQDQVSLAFVQCGRDVVKVQGYLHPGATGSDGEPLLLLATEAK